MLKLAITSNPWIKPNIIHKIDNYISRKTLFDELKLLIQHVKNEDN